MALVTKIASNISELYVSLRVALEKQVGRELAQ